MVVSKETIESGKILDMIDKWFNKLISHLDKSGVTIKKQEDKPSGGKLFVLETVGKGNLIQIEIIPSKRTDSKYSIKGVPVDDNLNPDKKNMKEAKDVDIDDVDVLLLSWVQEWFPGDHGLDKTFKDLKMSTTITVKKVEATNEVHLTGVFANYDAAYDVLEVLDSSEFLDSIPCGDEVSYELVPEDSCIDISECDEPFCNELECYDLFNGSLYIMKKLLIAEYKSRIIRYNTPTTSSLRCSVESLEWTFQSWQNGLAEVIKVNNGCVPNFMMTNVTSTDFETIGNVEQFRDDNEVAENVLSILNDLKTTIEVYYCNFEHSVQSMFDEWLRTITAFQSQF